MKTSNKTIQLSLKKLLTEKPDTMIHYFFCKFRIQLDSLDDL